MNPREVAYRLKPYVENLLIKKAIAQALREEINQIQKNVLAAHSYFNEEGGRIIDPSDSYEIVDRDHYYQTLHDIYIREGYELPEVGYCPTCIAESEESNSARELIKQAEPFFKVSQKMFILSDKRQTYLDLLIGLVLAAEREDTTTHNRNSNRGKI